MHVQGGQGLVSLENVKAPPLLGLASLWRFAVLDDDPVEDIGVF